MVVRVIYRGILQAGEEVKHFVQHFPFDLKRNVPSRPSLEDVEKILVGHEIDAALVLMSVVPVVGNDAAPLFVGPSAECIVDDHPGGFRTRIGIDQQLFQSGVLRMIVGLDQSTNELQRSWAGDARRANVDGRPIFDDRRDAAAFGQLRLRRASVTPAMPSAKPNSRVSL